MHSAMRRGVAVTLSCVVSLSVGCNSVVSTPSDAVAATITAPIPQATSQRVTAVLVQTPAPSITPNTEISATVSATPTVIAVEAIPQECVLESQYLPAQLEMFQGLVAFGEWDGASGIGIMGKDGFSNPAYFVPNTGNQLGTPFVAPGGEWFAYVAYEEQGDVLLRRIVAEMPAEGLIMGTELVGVELSRYDHPSWANEREIVVPLAVEQDTFSWVVWNPIADTQRTLAIELTDMGEALERFNVPPHLDPTLQLVVYPCDACGTDEYRVRDMLSGQLVWSIDLGQDLFRNPAVWSYDGDRLAVVGARDYVPNGLWIFDREGHTVHDFTLPRADGIIVATGLQWSPDNQRLAFMRNKPAHAGSQLAILTVADGNLVDLCIETATPVWAPDASKIAFIRQINTESTARQLTIVDLGSRTSVNLLDDQGHSELAWMWPIGP